MFLFNLTNNRTHPRSHGHIYCGQVWYRLVKFCRCYSVNIVKYGNFSNSRAENSESSGLISSIINLIRDLMFIYILTKFGDDWLIFVDARVLIKLEALQRLNRSTGLIFLQWQKKFLTIIIQSLHFSSLKKKGMEKTCEKRRKKWKPPFS